MHIAITGASGMIGRELATLATSTGCRVTRLVRRAPGDGEIFWDPSSSNVDLSQLDGVDAVVHLAGENIAAQRWTARFKQRIRDSRAQGTNALVTAVTRLHRPPRILVSASAVGYYGNRGDEELDELSAPGSGFLAATCQEWEAATRSARDAGIRVALLRLGMVLSDRGGALPRMLMPFRLGLGGRVGNGKQIWSWISLRDAASAAFHCIAVASLAGPVNAVSPEPVTNAQFTRALAARLRRPAWAAVPAWVARIALGEMADELLLSSASVRPRALVESGFGFQDPTLDAALRNLV